MNSKNTWSFFINRRPISWLIIITVAILGIFATLTIPKEIQPEISIPIGTVSTFLPGASPTDVESLITEPLEKEISTIPELKSLSSNSGLGISVLIAEFNTDADIDVAITKLKEKVDFAKSKLPQDATDPIISKAETNAYAIINFSIIGERTVNELSTIAEEIQTELEAIKGVSKVEIAGDQEKIIQITVDQNKAENYKISLEQISNALKFSNFNLPIGTINTDKINYSVRIDNRVQTLSQIQNIPITQVSGETPTAILIKDIATVEEIHKEQAVTSRLSINGNGAKDTLTLRVYKKDGGNVIEMADAAREKIEEIKKTLPNDIEIIVSNDNSEFIRSDLGILTKSGIQTTILIIIILFLALGIREGILAGLSIPLTLLAAVVVLEIQGLTINSLTLFSLVIALGLMVDTAIVIMEGIHENLKNGMTPKEAAIQSVETYKWALIAGTMTTVFAFFPMLLVGGIIGGFLRSLPITISAALLSSIFLSLTVIPSVTVKFIEKKDLSKKSILEPIFDKAGHIFEKFINKLVRSKFIRGSIIISVIVLFTASMSLPISGKLAVEMFPKTDFQYFIIDIETPQGVILDETEKIVKELETSLYEIKEVESFLTIIGSAQAQTATDLIEIGGAPQSNRANITVNLVDAELRDQQSYEIAQGLREKLQEYPKAKITVRELTEGPPSDAPITVNLTGENLDILKSLALEIEEITKKIPQTQNVSTSITPGLNEFKFTLNNEKVARHGLSVAQVSTTIRNAVQGIEATEVKIDDEDLSIFIKYDIPNNNLVPKTSIKQIENLPISTPFGYSVTLEELGEYTLEESLSSISREKQKRVIKVKGDIEKGGNAVDITTQLQEEIGKIDIPSGYEVSFGGETQDIEESFRDLFRSMIIGIMLIGVTLVLMFNSLKQPIIILLSLPLALIGVFPGLMSIGLSLSFPAFLGVVALSGVVVNDAIVLIDRINNNRKRNLGFRTSIAEAARARLQAIFMTSITTIVGILPLSLTNEFWSGLGFTLIFGLAFSTILVLIVIPTLYFMIEGRQARKSGELY